MVESTVVKYLNRLYLNGHQFSRGEEFAASFLFFHPNFGENKRGAGTLLAFGEPARAGNGSRRHGRGSLGLGRRSPASSTSSFSGASS